MNTNQTALLHKELSFEVVGAAMEVLNTLGHGLNDKVYENALVAELRLRRIHVDQQKRFKVLYKNVLVGESVPDLSVGESIIVEAKVVEAISDVEVGQVMNYLRLAKLELGIILNFRYPKLQQRRFVFSE